MVRVILCHVLISVLLTYPCTWDHTKSIFTCKTNKVCSIGFFLRIKILILLFLTFSFFRNFTNKTSIYQPSLDFLACECWYGLKYILLLKNVYCYVRLLVSSIVNTHTMILVLTKACAICSRYYGTYLSFNVDCKIKPFYFIWCTHQYNWKRLVYIQ